MVDETETFADLFCMEGFGRLRSSRKETNVKSFFFIDVSFAPSFTFLRYTQCFVHTDTLSANTV